MVRSKFRNIKAVLTYDSFASHTTISAGLVEKLGLKTTCLGDLIINTYGGKISQKGYKTQAKLDGSGKIDFIVSSGDSSIHL